MSIDPERVVLVGNVLFVAFALVAAIYAMMA